jgi:RNA polymerase sigma factor (sigma-70 family)
MHGGQLGLVLRHIHRMHETQTVAQASDGELLRQFVIQHDEAAFEALVRRHGGMVLGLCRRVLHDREEAEDAFQATFLVLVSKAASLRKPESVASWLFGVAFRIAKGARAKAARRRARQQRMAAALASAPRNHTVWNKLTEELDEELNRLPEKYRAPIVLHYLEGHSKSQTARQLGWTEGTVSGRLARARELLRVRLTRRGLTLSAGLITVFLTTNATPAAVPFSLLQGIVKAGLLFTSGWSAVSGTVSARALTLAQGVLKTMSFTPLKLVASLFIAAALAGAGVLAHQAPAERLQVPANPPPKAPTEDPVKPPAKDLQPVCAVEWGQKWWPAVVLRTKGEKYFVHYTGWEATWDEWVTKDRIRLLECKVEWKDQWWPAVLLQSKDGKHFIHYDGYDESWDEWVGKDRIRFKDCLVEWQGQWWPAVLLKSKEHGKHLIHYKGYDESWDEWVGKDRIRFAIPVNEGEIKPLKEHDTGTPKGSQRPVLDW